MFQKRLKNSKKTVKTYIFTTAYRYPIEPWDSIWWIIKSMNGIKIICFITNALTHKRWCFRNLNGILCEIRVDIPYGNGNKHDSRRFSIQNTKTSTFVGQSIRYEANDFNTIHAFYYPSYRIPWLYWVPVSCRKNIGFNCFFWVFQSFLKHLTFN
jgi:hypothetical protein